MSDSAFKRGSLTIEHILPQTWQTYWPLENTGDQVIYQQKFLERERIKHTLGNLTLVTDKLNPALSNAPWKKKMKELNKHSVLFLNKHLDDGWGHQSKFGEDEIQERSREFAKIVCAIWPSVEGI